MGGGNGVVSIDPREGSPPNTKLTELLAVFQDLATRYTEFQLQTPVQLLARLIDEPKNVDEITKFIQSYLWPPDLDKTQQGMAVMFILGYTAARGEHHMKSLVRR